MVEQKTLSLRGKTFSGKVVKYKAAKTATIEWERTIKNTKYERIQKKKNRVHAHVPDDMKLNEGDMVEIHECRPISKSKKFIITKIL